MRGRVGEYKLATNSNYNSSRSSEYSYIQRRGMGGQVSRSDFMWVYTQQPHVARRKIILGERL